ncbi:hypothetical protein F5Y14DRAFT_112206 [Nemania sp. NC0429]|nr:hypothetical protein F5Y14DRAFT_112206 [Nemania sp. NC0429]
MQLKRKLSDSELSMSTTSTFNSPTRLGPFSPPSTDMSMDFGNFSFATNLPVSPLSQLSSKNVNFPHVSGRTMKRFRDNRPSEQEVHQRTLNMLYAAQRHQTPVQPHEARTPDQLRHNMPVAAHPGPSSSLPSSHQINLHNFWNLPSRPSASQTVFVPPTTMDTPTECEDCGQNLDSDNDIMMDADNMSGTGGSSCVVCGKHVCSHCCITNLGEQRRCLGCAETTRRCGNAARATTPLATGMSSWLC